MIELVLVAQLGFAAEPEWKLDFHKETHTYRLYDCRNGCKEMVPIPPRRGETGLRYVPVEKDRDEQ